MRFLYKFLVVLSLLMPANAIAQDPLATITGSVIDKTTKLPVEFATIQLMKAKADSSLIKTAVTDKKGRFTLDKIENGNYILQFSFIGYGNILLPIEVNQVKEHVGTIEIAVISKNMSEVVVTGRKSLLNTSIDRKIYNVSQDIMAQSGSASDILRNIPSVEVDIEGEVTLRGATGVMILINGRPSPLMGKSRAEVLQQLPANSIERIEVITNPSARFKPDGTSGIINIVLKKNIKTGWNGTIVANAGNRERYNAGINLNYKPGKLNLFSNYNIRQDSRLRLNNINRIYLDSMGMNASYYTEDSHSSFRPLSNMLTIGMDYTASDQNSFGLSGDYYHREMTRRDQTHKNFYDKNNLISSKYDRLRFDPEYEKEKNVTAYWQHNFPREDHELRAEFNISSSDEKEDNHYSNIYYFPAGPPAYDNTVIRQRDNQQQLTIDYSNPLSEDVKLEAGYDGSFNQIDMNFFGEDYIDSLQRFVMDIIRTNRFKYSESIHAVYATYQHGYEKFGYEAGVRLEQVYIKGRLVTKDSLISNQYFKFYPTLHLSYKLKKGELQLNYSKRVNRPDGDELNPFPEYQDPYNLRAGNPKLLPEIIHSVEFGYKWQNDKLSFVPSIYYRYKQHGFTNVLVPLNDSVLLSTQQNLSNDRSAGLELIFSAKLGKSVTANLNSNFFYNQIDASNLGYSSNKTIVSMSSNFNSTIALSKTTLFQVSCNYRSARLTPQGKSFGNIVVNTGLRQDLFKKKVSLTLTASDIFKTLKQKTILKSAYLGQTATGHRDARIIYLGISYRFGKLIKKQNEEKLQFDNNL